MPIYMKFSSIAGDVTEAGHAGWIELNSFQWGVGRGVSSHTGSWARGKLRKSFFFEKKKQKTFELASHVSFNLCHGCWPS